MPDTPCQIFTKKLREAKNYVEIETDLEKFKPNGSIRESLRIAYQIRAKQPEIANHLMETVSRDLMDNEKRLQEYTGGTSDQATNRADPLKRVDRDTSAGQDPDTQFPGAVDQMGTANGSGNTKNNTNLSEDIMPGLHPDVARMMQQPMNNAPPMSLPMQVKQMQYTVRQMTAPLVKEIQELRNENTRLKDAYTALDKKVMETKNTSIPLNVESRNMGTSSIRESVVSMNVGQYAGVHETTEDKRSRLAQLDKALSESNITMPVPPQD